MRQTAAQFVGVAVSVALLAFLSIEFTRESGDIAALWPANALVACALRLDDPKRWPVHLFAGWTGCLAANLLAHNAVTFSVAISAINQFEVLICAACCRTFLGASPRINGLAGVGISILIAVGAAGSSGLLATVALGHVSPGQFPRTFLQWLVADALGLLVVTPALLAVSMRRTRRMLRDLLGWRGLLSIAAVGLSFGVAMSQTDYPTLFFMIPPLVLASVLLSAPSVAVMMLALAVACIVSTLGGLGPLGAWEIAPELRLVILQLFIASCAVTTQTLCSALYGLRIANDRIRSDSAKLRRLVAELSDARDAAQAAARVKAEFTSNMSHEIRTPLTAILGFTARLSDRGDLPAEAARQVGHIAKAGESLLAIVNDVLDFSKLEAGAVTLRPRAVSLAELLSDTLGLFEPLAAEKGLMLPYDVRSPLPRAEIDPDRLRQILVNLIGNAVKFTDKGSVRLAASYDYAGQWLEVSIADTGPGIEPVHQSKLFQRFSQVDGSSTRRHGGSGLGLAICRGLAEAMGGEIGVRSSVGVGSTFNLRIPAPMRAEGHPALQGDEHFDLTGVRILIADDNPANREIVRALLAGAGAEVYEAIDGRDAIEMAQATPFDIAVIDLHMPQIDGVATTKAIRTGGGPNSSIPILALTAVGGLGRLPNRTEDGFDGHVSKPIESICLLQTVAAATTFECDSLPGAAAAG